MTFGYTARYNCAHGRWKRSLTLTTLAIAVAVVPLRATVVLPIEVIGSDGFTQAVSVSVFRTPASGTPSIALKIHGLEYETQASVKVNGGSWVAINSSTAVMSGLAKRYGGIGGGFHTLPLTVALPGAIVSSGTNTITFRFNATDGYSSGYRVLDLDLLDGAGKPLVSKSDFVGTDPSAWLPPLSSSSDIAAGKSIWQTAKLTQPAPGSSPRSIRAHCMDCHAQDGRDLKYFNYSNQSIRVRSMFHGLSSSQGDQVASYIRSLTSPAPGRPWNPPYQPGPGLDARPAANWAAGAGLSAVLSADSAMLAYVTPSQTSADFSPTGNLNIRETPVAFQLPDWNHWLPRMHPVDVWGDAFLQSPAYTDYPSLRSQLVPNNSSAYFSAHYLLVDWTGHRIDFQNSRVPSSSDPIWSDPATATKIYSLALWQLMKNWELNQEFGLESMPQTIYGSTAELRSWITNAAFQTSPNIMKIPSGSPGLGNGTITTFDYESFGWYYMQLILNNSNKQELCTVPIDFGYFYGFLSNMSRANSPQAGLLLGMLSKALQISNNGYGPEKSCLLGWNIMNNDPSRLVIVENSGIWDGVTPAIRSSLIKAYVTSWFATAGGFQAQQFYSGGFTSANDTVTPGYGNGNWPSRFAFFLPRYRYLTNDTTLTNSIASWAGKIWPKYDWNAGAAATCSTDTNKVVHCTNDQ